MIDFAAELMLLVPAIRVIVRFRTSALRRLVAFPAVYRPAKGDAYRVILHRSVYCPPHGCSDFHLRSKRCSDLFVDGSRLLQRYHYLYTGLHAGYRLHFYRNIHRSSAGCWAFCTELNQKHGQVFINVRLL